MIGVGPAVEPTAEDLPHQQTAPALEGAHVAAGVSLAPHRSTDGYQWRISPTSLRVIGKARVVAGEAVRVVVVVEDQRTRRRGVGLGVTGYAAALQQGTNVAVELDVDDAGVDRTQRRV